MKKFLICTTALVSLAAGTALAEAPMATTNNFTVSAGGVLDFQAGFRSQKSQYKENMTTNNKNLAFNNYAKAYLKAEGKADAGFTYGGVVNLQTVDAVYTKGMTKNFDGSYAYVDTGLGRLELGTNYSVAKNMRVGAESIAVATGGINGDTLDYVNLVKEFPTAGNYNSYYVVGPFITSPDLIGDYKIGAKTQSRKITYYTPSFSGFQAGVSYTPDNQNTGDLLTQNGSISSATASSRAVKDLVSGGISYNNQFDQVGVSVAAVGDLGKGIRNINYDKATGPKHDLRAWNIGASVSYAGFSAAGSYGSVNKKFIHFDNNLINAVLVASNNTNGNVINSNTNGGNKTNGGATYWTAGAAYKQGPVGVSVTYLDSKYTKKNHFKNVVVGADYALAPGMRPYVEAAFFTAKTDPVLTPGATMPKLRGQAYLLGTEVRF